MLAVGTWEFEIEAREPLGCNHTGLSRNEAGKGGDKVTGQLSVAMEYHPHGGGVSRVGAGRGVPRGALHRELVQGDRSGSLTRGILKFSHHEAI